MEPHDDGWAKNRENIRHYWLRRLGSLDAKRTRGFGMKTIHYDNVRNKQAERDHNLEFLTPNNLLEMSDFVTIHVHLTPETRHGIGQKELELMKRSPFLINMSRRSVVDEKAIFSPWQTRGWQGQP